MSKYSSNQERRLWLWTLAVVVAIYSTLSLAGRLAGELREEGLLTNFFFLSFFLTGLATFVLGLRMKPGGVEIGVAIGIVAAYVMVFVRMVVTIQERTHLFEYSVVGALVYQALAERYRNGRLGFSPAILAVVVIGLVGLLDEVIQKFLPDRVFDPIDILFNFLAGLLAVLASVILGWTRRRFGKGDNKTI